MNNRRNGGFTLVELMVTIAVGSLITLAATTVLLLGLRINRQASDTMDRQYTVRIMMSVMEDMATGGTITGLESDEDSWVLYGEGEKKIFTYETATRAITAGNGTVLMENVIGSIVSLNDNGILTIGIETADGSYTSSVYCRQLQEEQAPEPPKVEVEEIKEDAIARAEFLKVLASQYMMKDGSVNPGVILDDNKNSTGWYYSEWYVLEKGKYGWDHDTPWCACYVSWSLNRVSNYVRPNTSRERVVIAGGTEYYECYWYASVDEFYAYLDKNEDGHVFHLASHHGGEYEPRPGDLIFFDWTGKGVDPAHVGVVFKTEVEDGVQVVYTIEGNYSDSVAIRKYPLEAKEIMGYGILDWVPDAQITK